MRRKKFMEISDADLLQTLAGLKVDHGYKIERVTHDPVSSCTVIIVSHPAFEDIKDGQRLPELDTSREVLPFPHG